METYLQTRCMELYKVDTDIGNGHVLTTSAELAAKRRRVAATLATISPEGRAKRKALNSLIEFYEERVRMRRAGARLFHSSLSRGFNAWLSCADPLDGTRAHFKTSHLRTRNAGTSTSRRGSRRCFAARKRD